MSNTAFVQKTLLRWARTRAGLDSASAAKGITTREKWEDWEADGGSFPSFKQAVGLAKKLHVPFGYLFLTNPPEETLPLPDLRTKYGAAGAKPSPAFLDVVYDALRKQDWYREYQEAEEAPRLSFVGGYSTDDDPGPIAASIRDTLGINDELRASARTWEDFLRLLIHRAEEAGVLVLRSGVVGNNPHRKLSVAEFQGFAISDDLAPLVFINGQDWKAAQIFTLAHELAHLWVGQSGISKLDYRKRSSEQANDIERLCDRVAAETLVPNEDFISRWQSRTTVDENLEALAKRYRVSQFVVLRRAYESEQLDDAQYWDHYDYLQGKVRGKGSAGGGDFYANLLARNSRTLTLALLSATSAGRVPYRDAARLLNVRMKTLLALNDRLSAGA